MARRSAPVRPSRAGWPTGRAHAVRMEHHRQRTDEVGSAGRGVTRLLSVATITVTRGDVPAVDVLLRRRGGEDVGGVVMDHLPAVTRALEDVGGEHGSHRDAS